MNTIKKVSIINFWGDKKVNLDFRKDINFLIGVNGSGKTTIINLIVAALNADYKLLSQIQFDKLTIELQPEDGYKKRSDLATIEVKRIERDNSLLPQIIFNIKKNFETGSKSFTLKDYEEDELHGYIYHINRSGLYKNHFENDIQNELRQLINLSWLSIHRGNMDKRRGDRNFESTIDQKVEELQMDLVKYFSQLNIKYTDETEKFQKNIFESFIESIDIENVVRDSKINIDSEKSALKSIFQHFKVSKASESKLNSFFNEAAKAIERIEKKDSLEFRDFMAVYGVIRVHSIVQKWNKVLDKQISINKPKELFLNLINELFQRKEIITNSKNELMIKTQSGKLFPLTNLSSGEKQLIIILGQSLLQDEKLHVYIADEPELSLHIEWQEKLVDSLKTLNRNSQIIFATHSPDIVAHYRDSVIKIEQAIS